MKDFLLECESVKNRFLHETQDCDLVMRSEAEKLLIMYDQMMDKIKQTPAEALKSLVRSTLISAVNHPEYQ